jgi:hypothetical protein
MFKRAIWTVVTAGALCLLPTPAAAQMT